MSKIYKAPINISIDVNLLSKLDAYIKKERATSLIKYKEFTSMNYKSYKWSRAEFITKAIEDLLEKGFYK